VSERKYRQRGYMDSDRGREEPKPKQPPQQRDREGPRSPRMMAYGEKVKCASCSAVVPTNLSADSACPKCNSDLHTCRQCTYFDPASRFECRNTCELFASRTVIERETSSGKPTDARQAFANLFKK
jgi:hypothetical protein